MEMGELRTLNLIKPKGVGNGKLRTYHIVTCLEDHFDSIYAAMNAYRAGVRLTPRIPKSKMKQENATTPRICVAPTLEQCVTAIGVMGIFRRCCGSEEDAYSYTIAGLEVYPVIVLTFEEDTYYTPTEEDVPDIRDTDELWITHSAAPISVELKWLNYGSLGVKEIEGYDSKSRYVCDRVTFVKPERWHIHPWLTGTGNKLDSSNEEYMDGDLPYDVCKKIEVALSNAGFINVSCANYHTTLVFVGQLDESLDETLELLKLHLDKRHSITITDCIRGLSGDTRNDIVGILFNYSRRGSCESIVYSNVNVY